MKRRRDLIICACLLIAMSVASQWTVFAQQPKRGELVVGLQSSPKTMDPRYSTDATGMRISHQLLFSTLVQFGADLRITPLLAERWETPDNKTVIFYLRKDVTFHDGKRLTAEDVKFTFEHLKNSATKSPFAGTYAIIERITVLNPFTVKFSLTHPTASFLTSIIMPILPKHVIEGKKEFAKRLIGSGPFKFVSQSPNQILLEKNPSYFLGSPSLNRVVFKIIKDDNTRFLKARKGELDLLINAIALKDISKFKRGSLKKRYVVLESPGLSYSYLGFNMTAKYVKDIRVRQAIAFGIDVDEIIKYRFKNHAIRSTGLLSPVNWYAEPQVRKFPHDPAKAKSLLRSAGFNGEKSNLVLELKTSNNPEVIGVARIIQAQLARIGIELQVKSYEWGTFYGDIKSGNYQMTSMRWVGVTEPDFYYNIFHSSQFPPVGRNRGLYKNSQIDRLSELGRLELNTDKRKAIYSKIQKIVAEELPYISLWHYNNISIVNRRVSGYQSHPMGSFFSFNTIQTR